MPSKYFEIRRDQIEAIIKRVEKHGSPVGNWCIEVEADTDGGYASYPCIDSATLICVCEDGESRSVDLLKEN